jgi:hypothetical protein
MYDFISAELTFPSADRELVLLLITDAIESLRRGKESIGTEPLLSSDILLLDLDASNERPLGLMTGALSFEIFCLGSKLPLRAKVIGGRFRLLGDEETEFGVGIEPIFLSFGAIYRAQ